MTSTLTSFGEFLKARYSAARIERLHAMHRPDFPSLLRARKAWRAARRWATCRTLTSSQRRRLDALRAQQLGAR